MSTLKILTIGYEGIDVDEFVERLKKYNVTRLIDVREIPISRKKGFSKTALKRKLEKENIKYVHFKSLGSPSPLRKKLKTNWDYNYFFKTYLKYLSKNMDAIKEVYQYISDGINCIMCFERTPEKCHRSAVADKINEYSEYGLTIKHI